MEILINFRFCATLSPVIEQPNMPKQCIVTGKSVTTGLNVSHAKNATKRKIKANLHKRKLKNPATGKMETVIISTRGLRTLKKWDEEGKVYDLLNLKK